jgi:hypothetical protein
MITKINTTIAPYSPLLEGYGMILFAIKLAANAANPRPRPIRITQPI